MIYWPFIAFFFCTLFIPIAMLALSALLGQRHEEHATGIPYEGGIVGTGSAHVRFSAAYYLIGMFFVIFDLEAVFIFSWAIAGRELGWGGYFELLVFVGILVVTLVYLWRLGGLDWGPKPKLLGGARKRHG